MKLLLDQGLPRGACALLLAEKVEAQHVADLGLSRATDESILEKARATGATIVTLDADFHQLLSISKMMAPSVIRIRVEGFKAEALAELLFSIITKCREDIEAGAAITVDRTRIRVYRLPLP